MDIQVKYSLEYILKLILSSKDLWNEFIANNIQKKHDG
jgi:hypothetical protein